MRIKLTRLAATAGFAPASPAALGALRAWLFGVLAVWALTLDSTALARLVALHWTPQWLFRLLPGPPAAGVLAGGRAVLLVAALLACVGLATRPAQLVATAVAVPLLGLGDLVLGTRYHLTTLTVLLLIALLPARLGDDLSLDRLRASRPRAGRPAPAPSLTYGWPLGLARVVVVFVYLGAGLAKLRTAPAALMDPRSAQAWLFVKLDRLADPSSLALAVAGSPWLAEAAWFGLLALELSVVAVLVWPRWRPVAALGIVAFHLISLAFGFRFVLMAAVAWAPLVDLDRLVGRLRAPRITPASADGHRRAAPSRVA